MRADHVSIVQKTCVNFLGENRIKSEIGITKLNYNATLKHIWKSQALNN